MMNGIFQGVGGTTGNPLGVIINVSGVCWDPDDNQVTGVNTGNVPITLDDNTDTIKAKVVEALALAKGISTKDVVLV